MGVLFSVRLVMFVYTVIVFMTDVFSTDRPRYEFCYLTQLSYLGLTSYLGTVSWHTLSEWRRERGLRAIKASRLRSNEEGQQEGKEGVVVAEMIATRPTTVERQHWFLTDMNFFLYHTICTFHVIVPILYWGFQTVTGEAKMMAVDLSKDSLWRNFSFHGLDLGFVLVEFSINSMPFIFTHILIVGFICLLYLCEAILVRIVDGFWLYSFLDVSVGPIWMAMYLGVSVAITAAFMLMYFLHRGRTWIVNRFTTRVAAQTSSFGPETVEVVDGAVPEMVVVSSSVPVNCQAIHTGHQSTFLTNTLPADTVIILTHQRFQPTHPLSIPTQILIQSRRRSYSNCSNDSTTSTLVGSDEGMMCKKDIESSPSSSNCTENTRPISERTARRLSMTLPQQQQQQSDTTTLEKVDEEEDHETEGGDHR
ncbi:hypothetical protein BGX29_011890 [Mortierella sp. GBA35]|nr:hypothetical protein BGX29_011890 [Mortierella sp. GBA35]